MHVHDSRRRIKLQPYYYYYIHISMIRKKPYIIPSISILSSSSIIIENWKLGIDLNWDELKRWGKKPEEKKSSKLVVWCDDYIMFQIQCIFLKWYFEMDEYECECEPSIPTIIYSKTNQITRSRIKTCRTYWLMMSFSSSYTVFRIYINNSS